MKCGKLCAFVAFLFVALLIGGAYISKKVLRPALDNPVEIIKPGASGTAAPPPPQLGDMERLLTVEGRAGSGCEAKATLSDKQLRALPQQRFKTTHTWSTTPEELSGPLLSDVLALVCPKAHTVYLRALNEYAVTVDFTKIKQYEPILAMDSNGKPLSIREKGPLWVMIDFDRFNAIPERSLDEMLVWQLYYLSIVTTE